MRWIEPLAITGLVFLVLGGNLSAQGLEIPTIPASEQREMLRQNSEALRGTQPVFVPNSDLAGLSRTTSKQVQRAAEKGEPLAQYQMGLIYAAGLGVSKNDAKAVTWFRKAAENGEPHGQFALGTRYVTGRGLPQDDAEAVRWFQAAASQQYAPAQFGFGAMYEAGRGVAKDLAQSVEWTRRAAEHGHAEARRVLAATPQPTTGNPSQ